MAHTLSKNNIFTSVYVSIRMIFSPSLIPLSPSGAAHSYDIDERILPPLSRISTRNNIPLDTTKSINGILENLGGSCPSELLFTFTVFGEMKVKHRKNFSECRHR
jgi:hypothetical protein